ncbi:hypothetical protein [Silvanigrella sp.]|jgi:hypothetical protein|uniref:hypothetical protein n=1 Tax=Silvanigrella sp. TaxID=2024976 RepID=UPI0037C87A23|nr:hypothetical protein [Silvanigrellaceae bacterium]
MTMKSSLKLTAVSVGVATLAFTACNNKSNDGKAAEAANSNEKQNTKKTALEISFGGSIPLGGCTTYSLSYTDAEGNKQALATSNVNNDKNLSIDLTAESKTMFKLDTSKNTICAVTTESGTIGEEDYQTKPKENAEATLIANYKDLSTVNNVSVKNSILKEIALKLFNSETSTYSDFRSLDIPVGLKSTDSLNIHIQAQAIDNSVTDSISDEAYSIEFFDSDNKKVDYFTYNPKTKGYVFDSAQFKKVDLSKSSELKFKVKVVQKNSMNTKASEQEINVNLLNPIVTEIKSQNIQPNYQIKTTNEFNFVAVYSDGSEQPLFNRDKNTLIYSANSDIFKNIKTELKLNNEELPEDKIIFTANSNKFVIGDDTNLISSKANKNHLTLNVSFKLNINEAAKPFYEKFTINANQIEYTFDNVMVIGNTAPKLTLAFLELADVSGAISYQNVLKVNNKKVAKGATEYVNGDSTDSLALKCVKAVASLRLSDSDSTTIVDNVNYVYTIPQSVTDKFSYNASTKVFCAKKNADLTDKVTIFAQYNGLKSNNELELGVDKAIKTNAITIATKSGKKEFIFDGKVNEVTLVPFETLSDDTLGAEILSTEVTDKLTYSAVDPAKVTPFVVNGNKVKLSSIVGYEGQDNLFKFISSTDATLNAKLTGSVYVKVAAKK